MSSTPEPKERDTTTDLNPSTSEPEPESKQPDDEMKDGDETLTSWQICNRQCWDDQLMDAIQNGNEGKVRRLLNQGASPNTRFTRISALHLAVALDFQQIVQLLLKKGASTQSRDHNGRQPIHIAAATGNLTLLQTLLNHDHDQLLNSPVMSDVARLRMQLEDDPRLLQVRDSLSIVLNYLQDQLKNKTDCMLERNRALREISRVRILLRDDSKLTYVRELLKDLDSFEYNIKKITPLRVVVSKRNSFYDRIQDLYSQIPKLIDGSTALHVTAEFLHKNCTEELLSQGASVDITNSWSVTALHMIGRAGSRENLQTQDSRRNDIDSTSGSSQNSVSSLGEPATPRNSIYEVHSTTTPLDIFRLLVSHGCGYFPLDLDDTLKMDYMQTTVLHNAVKCKDELLIENIVQQFGYETLLVRDKHGRTALHLALKLGNHETLSPIFSAINLEEDQMKEVVNARDREGRTLLHIAARSLPVACANLLVAKGADDSARTLDASTVLHYAAENPNRVLYELLTRCTSCRQLVNAEDASGETPIYKAVAKGNLLSTCLLVEHGADIIKTIRGNLSLVKDVCNLLMENWIPEGLHKDVKNRKVKQSNTGKDAGRMTLLHVAAIMGRPDILRLLLQDQRFDHQCKSISWRGNTALHFAVASGSIRCVQELQKAGFQEYGENFNFQTPLCLSILKNRNDILQLLIPYCKPDVVSFYIAALHDYQDCLKTIIYSSLKEPGSYFEAKNLLKFPWHISASFGDDHLNILKDLLEEGYEMSKNASNYSNGLTSKTLICGHFNSLPNLQILKSILIKHGDYEDKSILLHPFIETFLYVKWKSLKLLVYYYFALYIMFLLTFTGSVVYVYCGLSPDDQQLSDLPVGKWCLVTCYAKGVIDLVKLFHMIRLHLVREFLKSLEFWLTFLTDCLVSYVLADNVSNDGMRYVSALTILFVWLETFYFVSRRSTKALMFFTVAKNMIKVLFVFSLVFHGFAYAFMICFKNSPPFHQLVPSLIRVLSMTEEVNFESIMSGLTELNVKFEATGVLLLIFIFLVNLALMNLLVGLAVNDIESVEKTAKMTCIANQIDFLNVIETTLYLLDRCFSRCYRHKLSWEDVLDKKCLAIDGLFQKKYIDLVLPLDLKKRFMDQVKKLKSNQSNAL